MQLQQSQTANSNFLRALCTEITVYLEWNCNFSLTGHRQCCQEFSIVRQNLYLLIIWERFFSFLLFSNGGSKSLPRRHYCYRCRRDATLFPVSTCFKEFSYTNFRWISTEKWKSSSMKTNEFAYEGKHCRLFLCHKKLFK